MEEEELGGTAAGSTVELESGMVTPTDVSVRRRHTAKRALAPGEEADDPGVPESAKERKLYGLTVCSEEEDVMPSEPDFMISELMCSKGYEMLGQEENSVSRYLDSVTKDFPNIKDYEFDVGNCTV